MTRCQRGATPEKIFFLPGASGNIDFWRPAAELIRSPGERIFCGWPGFGPTPQDDAIHGLQDLADRLVAQLDTPSALVAQSMGGVIALLATLSKPELVTHLVLTATSGGIDTQALGACDWRPHFQARFPGIPQWFATYQVDLSARLPEIETPTLLLWGTNDAISPPAVGHKLASLLPHSKLHLLAGGTHDMGMEMAAIVAPLIDRHLSPR